MKRVIILLMVAVIILTACSISDQGGPVAEENPEPETTEPEAPEEESTEPETDESETPTIDPIEQLISEMDLRQRIGQLFLIRPDGLDVTLSRDELEDPELPGVTQLHADLITALERYPVGGFVLFDKNLVDPEQLRVLMAQLDQVSSIAPLYAIDEEGGLVSRLANHPNFAVTSFPNMAQIGQTGDPDQAYQAGLTIGNYLKDHGFHIDFAPVADVNSNPDNPVIGPRSFSPDPVVVAEMVRAAVIGFQEAGIISSLKHFPGHGDTAADSHFETAISYKNWSELLMLEMIPFQAGIDAGAEMVMMGHIVTPEVSHDGLPASLSPEMYRLLKQELGFDGIVLTDSLAMQAISDHFSPADAAVMTFQAGADFLLMPANLAEAFDAIEQAVNDGTINEAELDQRVRRILELKMKAGLLE